MAFIAVSRSRAAGQPLSSRALAIRLRVFAVVVLLAYVGAALLISAGLHTRSLGLPIAGGVKTQGVVVNERVTDEKSYIYRPIVVFLDAGGRRIEIEGAPRSSPAGLGRRVPVSYDPSDPSDARDIATNSTWLFQFGAGLVFLLVALGCTWLLWWVRRHGPIGAQAPAEPAGPFG
jgi:hypothetical protein